MIAEVIRACWDTWYRACVWVWDRLTVTRAERAKIASKKLSADIRRLEQELGFRNDR